MKQMRHALTKKKALPNLKKITYYLKLASKTPTFLCIFHELLKFSKKQQCYKQVYDTAQYA